MIEPDNQTAPVRTRQRGRRLALALACGLAAAPATASAMEPIEGLRSLALGSTLRGFAYGAEGLLLNPSGFAMVRQYALTALYSLRVQSLGHGIHLSVADSVTQQRIAVGLYYNFITESPKVGFVLSETGTKGGRLIAIQDGQLSRQGHEVGAATAFPFGDRFAIGVVTKYLYYSLSAPLTASQLPSNFAPTNPAISADRTTYDMGSLGNELSFDIGATLRLWNSLYIGVVGQNLWPHGLEAPTQLGTGLTYLAGGKLLMAADLQVNFTGYQQCQDSPAPSSLLFCDQLANRTVLKVGAGMEYLVASRVPLRAGYLYDSNLASQHVTGGIGYQDPRFGIDFGFRQRVAGGMETILVIGLRVIRD